MIVPRLFNLPAIETNALMTVAEGMNIPFAIKRVYWITSNKFDEIRGEHSHKSCQQLLVCISGQLNISLEDCGGTSYSYCLDSSSKMVLIPPNYWCKIEYSKNSVVLVMASHVYDEKDYIRDYEQFKSQTLV
ncbi:MAG: FdtA/QdtA family cupin domain-containing protein [Reichenbachiella sp.]|uniref:sugar 3,4-ketoisomerase n=1 Tax=Reichenbachiella sp. TaxID=2184521 RepID=UPI0032671647